MSCQCGRSYIVKQKDILFDIAQRELGDGNRWKEITKPNCTPFTEEEARALRPGDEVCLPTRVSNIEWAGIRSSPYGFCSEQSPKPEYCDEQNKGLPPKEYLDRAMKTMTGYFSGATPVAVWLVGEFRESTDLLPSGMDMGFPNPGGNYDSRIRFSDKDEHESYLSYFDDQGIKVFLQVESGDADMKDLIDATFKQYRHHPSVIGFGVDVEWYLRQKVNEPGPDLYPPVTDELAQAWEEAVKSYNCSYRIFLKHYHKPSYDAFRLPRNYRGDIIFINDSQGFPNYPAFLDEMVEFANFFDTNRVMFQIGYDNKKEPDESDKRWWSELSKPIPQTMGNELASRCRNPGMGFIWVDFTLRDIIP